MSIILYKLVLGYESFANPVRIFRRVVICAISGRSSKIATKNYFYDVVTQLFFTKFIFEKNPTSNVLKLSKLSYFIRVDIWYKKLWKLRCNIHLCFTYMYTCTWNLQLYKPSLNIEKLNKTKIKQIFSKKLKMNCFTFLLTRSCNVHVWSFAFDQVRQAAKMKLKMKMTKKPYCFEKLGFPFKCIAIFKYFHLPYEKVWQGLQMKLKWDR